MERRSHKDTYAIRAQGHLLVEKLELMLTLARLMERCAGFISVERAMSVNNTILDMSVVLQYNLTNFNPSGYEYAEPTE